MEVVGAGQSSGSPGARQVRQARAAPGMAGAS